MKSGVSTKTVGVGIASTTSIAGSAVAQSRGQKSEGTGEGTPRRKRVGAHPSEKSAFRERPLEYYTNMRGDRADDHFAKLRWSENEGKPICPKCNSFECSTPGPRAKRKLFRCRSCRAQFSLTSNTVFHSRKRHMRHYLGAAYLIVCGAKGQAALHTMRTLGWSYKAIYCLSHKFREAMASTSSELLLVGNVDIDGKQVAGHVREKNMAADRVDRRTLHNKSEKRINVSTAIERETSKTVMIATRTEAESALYIKAMLSKEAVVHCDEGRAWDLLRDDNFVLPVNHSEGYSVNGHHSNYAESSFSRLERMIVGIYHHIGGPHVQNYADECSFQETVRKKNPTERLQLFIGRCTKRPKSVVWTGYYQNGRKNLEKERETIHSILRARFIAYWGEKRWYAGLSTAKKLATSEHWYR